MKLTLRIAAAALAAMLGLYGTGVASAAAPPQEDMKARHAEMKAHHDMTARHADMMARMASLDARIQLLTQEMNSFMGEARIDAMAALLAAVVEQNQTMRSAMAEMKGGMATMMSSCSMHEKPDPAAAPSHDHAGPQE